PGSLAPDREFRQSAHEDGRVSLAGGVEVRVHAEMQSQRTAAEPDPATCRQIRGFRFLDESQDAAVEGARRRFLSRRHRELNVIEAEDFRQLSFDQSWSRLEMYQPGFPDTLAFAAAAQGWHHPRCDCKCVPRVARAATIAVVKIECARQGRCSR